MKGIPIIFIIIFLIHTCCLSIHSTIRVGNRQKSHQSVHPIPNCQIGLHFLDRLFTDSPIISTDIWMEEGTVFLHNQLRWIGWVVRGEGRRHFERNRMERSLNLNHCLFTLVVIHISHLLSLCLIIFHSIGLFYSRSCSSFCSLIFISLDRSAPIK